MLSAFGRSAGRIGSRYLRSRFRYAINYGTAKRFKSSLNLPSLDEKWRAQWRLKAAVPAEVSSTFGNSTADRDKEQILYAQEGKSRGKMYILPMFPYPSGDLHLGHLRVYTISDVLSRFQRMNGYDVIHPIGWDGFGLPAENAAMERGIDPRTWTEQNIEKMKSQLEAMNGHWDWDREFATCDPKFYKHTQKLFILLHEAGLAYQREALVNYDPVDKTVLANEQVDANGCSWRSGAKVEKKMLKQWFLKISEYQDQLLDDLKVLDENGAWPDRVLAQQRNWLGKSTGARIKFPILANGHEMDARIEVFTTRPDTLFGVQYLAVAPSHPIVQRMAAIHVELQAFLDTIPALPEDSKVGFALPDVRALNPLAFEDSSPDAIKATLPIYVAPYVLGDYGEGAVMGVPGHDLRDHAFWNHNTTDDPIRMVISESPDGASTLLSNEPFVHHGHLTRHAGPYAGMSTREATNKIVTLLEAKELGSAAETWRLRDWLISRQRYWGTPIPIIHCHGCGPVPVPDKDLPVELPNVDHIRAQGKTGNPLDHCHEWVNTVCPRCGEPAKRDTDTMDTFVDSSWYYMRFADPHNNYSPFSTDAADAILPVDIYIGGVEHAILHLLYARFISKFIVSRSLWKQGPKHRGEPFKKLLAQGMVHGKTYSDPSTGRFLKPGEVDLTNPSKPLLITTGETPIVSFEKMSKSKYNGVDPAVCMEKYGADATRAHILFQAPVSEVLEWDEEKIAGITRWMKRVHDIILTNKHHWSRESRSRKQFGKPAFDAKKALVDTEEVIVNGAHVANYYPMNGVPDTSQVVNWLTNSHNYRRFSESEKQHLMSQHTSGVPTLGDIIDMLRRSKLLHENRKKMWRHVQGTISRVRESYDKTYSLNTVVSDLMALTNAIQENILSAQLAYDQEQEVIGKMRKGPPIGAQQGVEAAAISEQHYHGLENFIFSQAAMQALLKMMAPITPAFAEECWHLISRTSLKKDGKDSEDIMLNPPPEIEEEEEEDGPEYTGTTSSIFEEPFPEADGTYADLLAPRTQECAVQINGRLRFAVSIPVPDDALKGSELEAWLIHQILETEDGRTRLMGREGRVDVTTAKKVVVVKGGKVVNFVV